MKKAVIMSRVSSDEQAKGFSLDVQYNQLTNYCNRNDIQIVKHYREDHSAKNFNRPEFQNFLQFVKKNKGAVDLLLITSWDRFSRNLTDSLMMLRTLNNLGIEVQAIEQPIDMRIPENKAMLALFLAIPEIDNDRRSIKIKGGIRGSLKAGRWCRKAPIGYKNIRDSNNRPIVILGDNANKILNAFQLFSEGKLQSDILKDLRSVGLKISRSNFSKLLRNPFYIGKIIVPKFEDEPMEIIEGLHEAIVPLKLFLKVQDILKNNSKTNKASGYNFHREEFPLRGLISCSKCDSILTASKSRSATGRRYSYYHCNNCHTERFPADNINENIKNIIDDFKFSKEAKELYLLMVNEVLLTDSKTAESEKVELTKKLNEQNIRIQNLQDLYIDGKIEFSQYNETMARYTENRTQITDKIESYALENNGYRMWLKDGVNMLSNLKNHYLSSDVGAKQELISSIFPEKIFFDGIKCRTQRINDVFRLILQIDKGLHKEKSGQISKNIELSTQVESPRIELGSKQATKRLSTRLFPDWVFDFVLGQEQPHIAYLLNFEIHPKLMEI